MNTDVPEGEEPSLTDLVPVTTARNAAEASMIVALLEDEEIPAIITGMNASNTFAGMSTFDARICVPRSMKEKAVETLDRIRSDAESKGVDDAFNDEHQQELLEDKQIDPELALALQLQPLDPEIRLEKLRILMPKWLADHDSNVHIAERLAAAGLTREQADEFMKSIKDEESILQEARDKRTLTGLGLLAIGIIILALKLLPLNYGVVLCVAGLGIMASAANIQPRNWKAKRP